MKKTTVMAIMALCAATAFSQARTTAARKPGATITRGKPAPAAEDGEPVKTKEQLHVEIDQPPMIGSRALMSAPSLVGTARYFTKPRSWIVLETKYSTFAIQERLTFEWHVLLDTMTASENKGNKTLNLASPFSYFTQTVSYQNIPKGTHAASVCLHPSYYECYGEPKAVGLVIRNEKGDILKCCVESEIKKYVKIPPTKPFTPTGEEEMRNAFWNADSVMHAKPPNGEPVIERRTGLVDRSKTIWALVYPNDYEMVVQ